jgi:K+-sensing histidine kinase KdpD
MPSRAGSIIVSWLIGIAGVGAAIAAGRVMHLNASTVGFAFLMAVLFASLRGGLVVGAVTSIAATLCYNYFFLPPLHTFAIREPSNWVALAAFLVTSVTVSRLVIAAKVQAERAEQRRSEVERLSLENAHVEALRESEMLKTSLLRAISHDLTTPLTAITLHTEALRRMAGRLGEDHEGEQWKAPIAGIAGETSRLHRRIDNLLSMARLEAGKAQPRPEPTPPADLFHAVRENLPLVFEARAVSIRVDDDCPDANVDPSLALEILVNLIENAHRVSPPEWPVCIRATRCRCASKCATAGRVCRPVWPTARGTCSPARRATSPSAASDWRSRAAWRWSTAAASASHRAKAEARWRASTCPRRLCRSRNRCEAGHPRRRRRPGHPRVAGAKGREACAPSRRTRPTSS